MPTIRHSKVVNGAGEDMNWEQETSWRASFSVTRRSTNSPTLIDDSSEIQVGERPAPNSQHNVPYVVFFIHV